MRTYSYREYYLGLIQNGNGRIELMFLIEHELNQKMHSSAITKEFILVICNNGFDFYLFFKKVWQINIQTGTIISAPFVVITMVVYVCIPELRNLHGKCFFCYMLSLLIGYICTATTRLSKWRHDDARNTIFGYLIYGSYMSAFLWSNVNSFDLWRNFRWVYHKNIP